MTNVRRRKARPGKSPAQTATKKFVMTPLAAAIVVALSPAGPALAQEVDAARIDEIIVTATRRELNLQDVAQSITALSASDIEEMGIVTMDDYVKVMPSIGLVTSKPGINSLVMRGISTGSYEYRRDAQVAVYLDDQAMTTSAQHISVRAIDMQRIETLPGPQSTLFGSSSQSGTLRLITNKPDSGNFSGEIEADVGFTSGGDASHDLNGFLNIPLVEDKLAMRAVAYTSHDGGWVDNVYGLSYAGNFDNANVVRDDYNEYDVDGGRLSVLWNMSDNWSTLLSYVAENTDSVGEWETDPSLGERKIVRFFDDNRQDEWYSSALTLNGDLGSASLSLTASHFERDIAYEWDNNAYSQKKDRAYGGAYLRWTEDCYAANPNYGDYSCHYYYADNPNTWAPRYYNNYAFSTLINDQQQERDSAEIRLQSQGDSKLQWMIGGYYEEVFDEWFYYTNLEDLVNTTGWAYAQSYCTYYQYYGYPDLACPLADTTKSYAQTMARTNTQIAVFGEIDYDFTEKLRGTLGIRWAEHDRTEFDRYEWPVGLPNIGGYDNGSYSGQVKTDDTFYKVGLQYQIDDDRMIYGLFSQGFRLGGANSSRAAGTGLVPQVYGPDYLDNYEIGLKSEWLDNTLQVNLQAFYMKWTDYQVSVWGLGAWWIRGSVNAGDAESTGIEANATWQATDNFKVRASLFAADAEFTEDYFRPAEPGEDPDLQIRKGMVMPGSPDLKAFLSFTYDVPDVLGGDMWMYFDRSYQSETWNNTGNIRDNDTRGLSESWTHSNLQAGLDFKNDFSITLRVNNVFDEDTHTSINDGILGYSEEFPDSTRDKSNRNEGRPRTAWLSLRKGF